MPADVKGHVVAANVSHGPFNLYRLSGEGELLLKAELEREYGACLRGVVGEVGYGAAFVGFQLKLRVLQKAVLAHFVRHPAMPVLAVPHGAYCGEEHRAVSAPDFRVGLPHEFLAGFLVPDAAQFRAKPARAYAYLAVVEFFHFYCCFGFLVK